MAKKKDNTFVFAMQLIAAIRMSGYQTTGDTKGIFQLSHILLFWCIIPNMSPFSVKNISMLTNQYACCKKDENLMLLMVIGGCTWLASSRVTN